MSFEGEKFEEIPTPPPEEEEKEAEKVEEKTREEAEEKPEEAELEKEEISPEEEKIYQQYREIEEKQRKLGKALQGEFEKDKKEIAKEFGTENLDEMRPAEWREDSRVKRFEKESKKIEEMKNPVKKEILKKFKEVDPEAPEKMIEELKKRREELAEEIWKIGEMTRGTGHTEMFEEEKEEIEKVIKDFENKDSKSLKDFTKQELGGVFGQVVGDEWRGERGSERLKKAIFLKKVLNTLERK